MILIRTSALGLAVRGVTIDIADLSMGFSGRSVGALRRASQGPAIASAPPVVAPHISRCFHLYYHTSK